MTFSIYTYQRKNLCNEMLDITGNSVLTKYLHITFNLGRINLFYSENDLTDNNTILNVLYQHLRIIIKNLICLVYYIPFLKPKCVTNTIYKSKDRLLTMITSLFVFMF